MKAELLFWCLELDDGYIAVKCGKPCVFVAIKRETMLQSSMMFCISLILLSAAFGMLGENMNIMGAEPVLAEPNIIVIIADDLDVGSVAYMGNMKEMLARQGVTFTNFFASFQLCCPSRVTILRGQYAHNTQILGNSPPNGRF